MPPHHLVLLAELNGISAASKIFFVKFLQRFSGRTSFCFGVKLLASELAVTDRVVTNALKELTVSNYLTRAVSIKGRGRPTPTYTLGDAYFSLIRIAAGDGQMVKAELVDRVLESRHTEKEDGLSTVNRLLLTVLLGHSDRVGTVSGLGIGKLCRLTGLTPSSIQRQLKKLHALKSIRGISPGVMASDLFGSVSSSFFMNLQNPTSRIAGEAANFFVYTPITGSTLHLSPLVSKSLGYRILAIADKHSRGIAKRFYEAIWSDAEGLLPELDRIEKLSAALKVERPKMRQISMVLQSRLNEYASFILSRHWLDLASNTYTPDPTLIDKITYHLMGKGAKAKVEVCNDLALLLHDTAVLLARWIQEMMCWVVGTPYESMAHVILLYSSNDGLIIKYVIISYSDTQNVELGYYVLSDILVKKRVIRKCQGEIDLW